MDGELTNKGIVNGGIGELVDGCIDGCIDSINELAKSHLPSAIWQFHYLELA